MNNLNAVIESLSESDRQQIIAEFEAWEIGRGAGEQSLFRRKVEEAFGSDFLNGDMVRLAHEVYRLEHDRLKEADRLLHATRDQRRRLMNAGKVLLNRYLQNPGTDFQFIACITPEGSGEEALRESKTGNAWLTLRDEIRDVERFERSRQRLEEVEKLVRDGKLDDASLILAELKKDYAGPAPAAG